MKGAFLVHTANALMDSYSVQHAWGNTNYSDESILSVTLICMDIMAHSAYIITYCRCNNNFKPYLFKFCKPVLFDCRLKGEKNERFTLQSDLCHYK